MSGLDDDKAIYKETQKLQQMKRLTALVSGKVQKMGYRAKVIDYARMLGLNGTVENLDDGRVKIIAEGDEDKLKWFEDAIAIRNALIQVSSVEREYSAPRGDFSKFYKLVEKGETDSRLDTAASYLKDLIGAVNNMNDNLGGKIDQMNDNLSGKMDVMIDLQKDTLNGQEAILEEVRESRKDIKGYLDQRFEKLESEVVEMRTALKGKGII